jgi:hypothetical protein
VRDARIVSGENVELGIGDMDGVTQQQPPIEGAVKDVS